MINFVFGFLTGMSCILQSLCNPYNPYFVNSKAAAPYTPSVTLSDHDSMNQNVTVSLNISPTQIKTSTTTPKKNFSQLPLEQWKNSTASFLYRKKLFIAASAALGSYIYVCYIFYQGNKYLAETNSWASWKKDIPYESLVLIPQKELANQLILEIQRKYTSVQNPTDFVTPLINFAIAIDKEIILTKRLNNLYVWIHKLHLNVIFPIEEKYYVNVAITLSKLQYLKNIFLVWAAEYKIDHNKRWHTIPIVASSSTDSVKC